ncbi:MAG: hypothetical protein U0T75_00635 [Chitinophagales bacterium]
MLKVRLAENDGYTGKDLDKLNAALKKMEEILNSAVFKERVLHYKLPSGAETFFYRPWQIHYTNQEVYDTIMKASELMGYGEPNVVNLSLRLLPGGNGDVVGYGNPGDRWINTYKTAFDQMDISDLVNHYGHEWLHKLGFEHDFQKLPKRKYSVPYAVGDILESLAN